MKRFLEFIFVLTFILSSAGDAFGRKKIVNESAENISGQITQVICSSIYDLRFGKGDPGIVFHVSSGYMSINVTQVGNQLLIGSSGEADNGKDISYDRVIDDCEYIELTLLEVPDFNMYGNGRLLLPDVDTNNFEINCYGVGDVKTGKVSAVRMGLKTGGTGTVHIESVDCDTLDATLTGVGDVSIDKVDCTNASLMVAGVGSMKVKDLDCNTAYISVGGVGGITVLRGDCVSLSAINSGIGDINVKNIDATNISRIRSGIGNIYITSSH